MSAIISTYLFWQFVILNFINVLINTARSISTIKGGKWVASCMNALCYGYYTVIIVITATYDMPLIMKCIAVAIVNFIGVFTIKFCEEKLQKDKKWIFLATAKIIDYEKKEIDTKLSEVKIKYVSIPITQDTYSYQIFSKGCTDSIYITSLLEKYNIKYSAVESKL